MSVSNQGQEGIIGNLKLCILTWFKYFVKLNHHQNPVKKTFSSHLLLIENIYMTI
jgi:hypothetical protein